MGGAIMAISHGDPMGIPRVYGYIWLWLWPWLWPWLPGRARSPCRRGGHQETPTIVPPSPGPVYILDMVPYIYIYTSHIGALSGAYMAYLYRILYIISIYNYI